MLQLIICIFLSFDGSSVSTARRGEALFMNPAGLGINQGYECIYLFENDWHLIGLSSQNSAFGIELKQKEKPSFTLGSSMNIGKSFWLGYNYNFGKSNSRIAPTHKLGGIFRPKKFVSFGLVIPIEEKPVMRGGISLKPGTDRVTIFCDALFAKDSLENLIYGIGVEPLDGVIFSLSVSQKGNFTNTQNDNLKVNFGTDISFGNLKIGGNTDAKFEHEKASLILSREQYPTFMHKKKKIVKLTLKGSYPEMQEKSEYLGFKKSSTPRFYNLLSDLEVIKEREDVKCLFIHLKPYSLGIAQAEELRQELLKIKKAGKKIITFSEGYAMSSYYLSSVADYIILPHLGSIVLPGLAANKMYLKGTLEKLGIETDIAHIGKYKSAREMLERESMSEEDREQLECYLDDIWEPMVREIAQSRNMKPDSLLELINNEVFFNSEKALNFGLIDTVAYQYEIDDILKEISGKSSKQESMEKFLGNKELTRTWKEDKPKIALLIAEGSIATGKSGYNPIPIIGGKYMGSETISKLLNKIRKDKSIRALVLRVNSGGGSAFASDIIAKELKRVAKEKPVIVSMSNVAASGGYEISCFADTILADRFTLTGSIGVFGVHPVLTGLYDKFGIGWDTVKRGKHADYFSTLRHFTEEEQEKFEQEIEWYYDWFITEVAEGRGLDKAKVDSIAQGRIWSGTHAKKIGLTDEIGGLLRAIEIAKEKANIEKAEIVIFPEIKKKFFFGASLF